MSARKRPRCLGFAAALLLCSALGSVEANADFRPCVRQDGTALRDAHWAGLQPGHPLRGQVLKHGQPIAVEAGNCVRSPLQQLIVEVWTVLGEGGIVLLGEVHDNSEQHLVRADMLWPRLESLSAENGPRPAAVFEHLYAGQQARVENFYAVASNNAPLTAEHLLQRLDWRNSGWPSADIFYPLFDSVLGAKLPVVAGDAPRDRVRALTRQGASALPDDDRALLDMSAAMPKSLRDALTKKIESSYCELMPAAALEGTNAGQRYRDAHMAKTLIKAAEQHGSAILLAGNDHVRRDRGVPWYLGQLAPEKKVVTVMLREEEVGWNNPQDYLPFDPHGHLAADYVLFTPAHDRPDYCAKVGRHLQSNN